MPTIGCYHAHYTNIELIEQALGAGGAELVHYVDPGLDRIKADSDFTPAVAERKVAQTLDWIASSHVDAILITCTFFSAVYKEQLHRMAVPVIRIEDPLFSKLASAAARPMVLAFTNPATVAGTMEQLQRFAAQQGIDLQAEAALLEDTFPLIMQGHKEEYNQAVSSGLLRLAGEHPGKQLVAAQLSMVPAAREVSASGGSEVWNQLDSLADYVRQTVELG
ncbi:hypothetical protein [Paenibacillus donghaensis]|uniref:Asp/Glu/hydantoin racemase n=1 Tax=Paenibacillus donghaensis TaxID=414771 RepID=A0A2Z2K9Q2_9BACL|nr:hypothetical protein [Paenibacillus donghaensis]ASA19493.1 hypothetical protein B9T62_00685 [Paenibacillus donghaensis]